MFDVLSPDQVVVLLQKRRGDQWVLGSGRQHLFQKLSCWRILPGWIGNQTRWFGGIF